MIDENRDGNYVCGAALGGHRQCGRYAAQECQAAKDKAAGKYSACRLNAYAKGVVSGLPPDYTRCDAKQLKAWTKAESTYGVACPTSGDQAALQTQVTDDATEVAARLVGVRFIDNGDGTITDMQTGLMWEKKDNLDSVVNLDDPHDADNTYTWNTTHGGSTPDGTAFTDFLDKLNNCTSPDGISVTGGFAGHCDWRLPTIAELSSILDLSAAGCGSGSPCIGSIFGPTQASFYWSSSTHTTSPSVAWNVTFDGGIVGISSKFGPFDVRAVRGAL